MSVCRSHVTPRAVLQYFALRLVAPLSLGCMHLGWRGAADDMDDDGCAMKRRDPRITAHVSSYSIRVPSCRLCDFACTLAAAAEPSGGDACWPVTPVIDGSSAEHLRAQVSS